MEEPPHTSATLAIRLGARIVHDLAGPAHGLRAALALLSESGDVEGQAEARAYAMAIAADLEARLSFCRAAYGGAPPPGARDLEVLSQTPFDGRRGRLRWVANAEGAPPALASTMLIFARLASAGLAAGGEALATVEGADGRGWSARLEATGPRLRMDPQALGALAGAAAAGGASGRWVEGALARALIVARGGMVVVDDRGDAVILEARLPPAP